MTLRRLETERLVLTPLGPADFVEMRRLHGDATAMVTLSADGRPFGEAATSGFLERCTAHWDAHGFGVWSIRLRDGGAWVGYAGIRRRDGDAPGGGDSELLYGLLPEAWGRGYAQEAGAACLADARGRPGVGTVVCFTLWSNAASRAVMTRLGFRGRSPILHAGLPHVLMRLG